MAQGKLIKNHRAILDKRGLPFFIIALGIFWVGVCAWAESSFSVNCAIPEVAGLNTPTVEEETIETAQEEAVVKKTLYSR